MKYHKMEDYNLEYYVHGEKRNRIFTIVKTIENIPEAKVVVIKVTVTKFGNQDLDSILPMSVHKIITYDDFRVYLPSPYDAITRAINTIDKEIKILLERKMINIAEKFEHERMGDEIEHTIKKIKDELGFSSD